MVFQQLGNFPLLLSLPPVDTQYMLPARTVKATGLELPAAVDTTKFPLVQLEFN